jgi:hypothetical protein
MRIIGVVITVLAALGASGNSAHAQQAPVTPTAMPPTAVQAPLTPVARPDLALSLRDVPPGYEDAPPVGLTLGTTQVQDRALRRPGPGIGPFYIWSVVYEAVPPPMTEERLGRLTREIAVIVTRSAAPQFELSDWNEMDATSLGDFAQVYSFRFRLTESNAMGEGGLAVFSRANTVAYLIVMNADGRAAADLRQYGLVLDGRIQRDLSEGPSSGGERPAPPPASTP